MNQNDKLLQPFSVSRATYKCGATERKILFFAALKVQQQSTANPNISEYSAEFALSEILKTLGMNNTQGNRELIKSAVKTIAQNSLILAEDEKNLDVVNWLQRGIFNIDNNTVKLIFSNLIGELFYTCRQRYSLINPRVIGAIKSFYAMRYYEIALSYNGFSPWRFYYSLDELRTMYQIDGYQYSTGTAEFIRRVVTYPIEELNKVNPDFVIELEKVTDENDKRRTKGFYFNCKKFGAKKKKTGCKRSKNVLNGINEALEERKPFERFDTLYHEEFRRRIDELKCGNPLELEATAQEKAYKSMVADGYK